MRDVLDNCKNHEVLATKNVRRGVRNPFSKWKTYGFTGYKIELYIK